MIDNYRLKLYERAKEKAKYTLDFHREAYKKACDELKGAKKLNRAWAAERKAATKNVKRLREHGLSVKEIAEMADVSTTTVRKYIKMKH